jgi:hypothetical protein
MNQSRERTNRQFLYKVLLALVLVHSVAFTDFAQSNQDETKTVVVEEQVMKQVVRRILIWNFKPRNQKKIIYLADKGIQKSWLPEIKGIEFRLLNESEVVEKHKVYFFTELEKRPLSKYYIGFAFGDPDCEYTGTSWVFRISKEKVKLWQPNGGFGAGCSSVYDANAK